MRKAMNPRTILKPVSALLLTCMIGAASLYAADYEFDVTNSTSQKITAMQAAPQGTNRWIDLNVGAGIKPGVTVTMVWGQHTLATDCNWQLKARYANGKESKLLPFNFCKDKEAEFKD